jgi:PPOX class probable F420-dependent enzyme
VTGHVLSTHARSFLKQPRFGVLATVNADGTPHQSVVWYELDGEEILLNTKLGRRKEHNLRRTGAAGICVEDGYRHISISGPVTLIDDQVIAQADIERLALRYEGQESAARQMRDQFSNEQRVTVRLRIDKVVGYGIDGKQYD